MRAWGNAARGKTIRGRAMWGRAGWTAVVALVVGAVLTFVTAALGGNWRWETMAGGSMEPHYQPGQAWVGTVVRPGDVKRGDVVLFHVDTPLDPAAAKPYDSLKRVIALGGDHVSQHGSGPVVLNGRPLREPYLAPGKAVTVKDFDVVVPAGRMFVLGDHRADSVDSRFFATEESGTVPLSTVIVRDDHTSTSRVALVAIGSIVGLLLLFVGLVAGVVALALRGRRARAR